MKGKAYYKQEIMVLRLCTKILEDGLFPVPFHVIPVIDHAMANGIMNSISL